MWCLTGRPVYRCSSLSPDATFQDRRGPAVIVNVGQDMKRRPVASRRIRAEIINYTEPRNASDYVLPASILVVENIGIDGVWMERDALRMHVDIEGLGVSGRMMICSTIYAS